MKIESVILECAYQSTSISLFYRLSQNRAISALEFWGDSYLLSAGEDNTVCIWRVNDWVCVHILGGHKDVVHDISIHPSGKMAMSSSKDGTLKLWNLIEGRCAFTRRLKGPPATLVSWSNCGDYYLVVSLSSVQIFTTADNACMTALMHTSRVNKAAFTPSISKIRGSIDNSSSCTHVSNIDN